MTAHHEPLAQLVDALMVVGAGLVLGLPRGARRERSRGQAYVVLGTVEGADHASVLAVAEMLGQMLAQRTARARR